MKIKTYIIIGLLITIGLMTFISCNSKSNSTKTTIKKKDTIPKDLEVILIKPFNSVVYKSMAENRIFIDYYYEEGFFQGNLILELNSDEIIEFNKDSNTFLNDQSNLISKDFKNLFKLRNIKPFIEEEQRTELIKNWRIKNE
ncbi:hypothetical protein IWQ47_000076 [Aquimarina sp. EL_43]|uniref:hypothetical protein n=1 Tax=unclassified Aquimarina TaxID=2627091 RepID=UPI0018CB4775|nr:MULTISPECIES: hypothetical protein [unclassified Aquimarina]MBG6129231.1 hypothetical protein [Aquimarina sp. EL_35]MBG6150296.1 hypothetical protein [Aquimarina sp. EL_32]MBG6167018.1 hypothetical protein [Aquimarina sp. EL_43]